MSSRPIHRNRAVLVDTNLLLVLLVGSVDPEQIPRFTRTRAYTPEDYRMLVRLVGEFDRVLTTPHVLTETSNLLGQLGDPLRRKVRHALAELLQHLVEEFTPSQELVQDTHFVRLGLTDIAVTRAVKEKEVTVVTADLPLYVHLTQSGVHAINYNHLRSGSW